MDLARAIAADLRDLAIDLSAGGYTRTTLLMLKRNLSRRVPAILGGTVTLVAASPAGATISVNMVGRVVGPHEIAAALEIALGPLLPDISGTVVIYSGEPDAFVELAAELAEALNMTPFVLDPHPPLPAVAIAPNADGLEDFSLVDRAMGVLLNRGYSVDDARTELGRRAARSQTAVTAAARVVLASAGY